MELRGVETWKEEEARSIHWNHPTMPLKLKNHPKPSDLKMHLTSIKSYKVFSPSNTQISGKEQITFISKISNETEFGEKGYISKYSVFQFRSRVLFKIR